MKIKKLAIEIICAYLNQGMTAAAINDIYEIRHGNDQVLLGHLTALRNIFDAAIKEIEDERKN